MPSVSVKPFGEKDDDMWAVDGYPATTLLVGLAKMDHEPDLVSFEVLPFISLTGIDSNPGTSFAA